MKELQKGHSFRPRYVWAIPAATLGLIVLLILPPLKIGADSDEVILSIEVVDLDRGLPVSQVSVAITSDGSQVNPTLWHGGHATIQEGSFVELVATLPSAYEVHHWEGMAPQADQVASGVFTHDTLIRLVVSLPEYSNSEIRQSIGTPSDAPIVSRDALVPEASLASPANKEPEIAEAKGASEVWVDFYYFGPEKGTQTNPFSTTAKGVASAISKAIDTVNIRAGATTEVLTTSGPVRLVAPSGTVRIGVSGFATRYTLSTGATGSGSVSPGGDYLEGEVAVIGAYPVSGWAFSHWEGDLEGYENPANVLMNADQSVRAVFLQNAANLRVTGAMLSGGGAVPTIAMAGDSFTLEWTVLNDSGNPATKDGIEWTDDVFLSRDDAYGAEDKSVSPAGAEIVGPIGGGNSYMASASVTIPDASPGDYYLLVRTDVGGEIVQTEADRNDGVLALPLTLIDPEFTQ